MLWDLLRGWLGLDAGERAGAEEAAARLGGELCALEQEIAAIAGTLLQCESALEALCVKESLLREGLEALLMESHDYDGAGSPESAAEVTADVWCVLDSVQRRREELQARCYQMTVTMRCLEAEKETVAQSLERLEVETRRAGEEWIGAEAGVTRSVMPAPPVSVLLVEKYREDEHTQ